jgi:hypothetical protein
MKKNKLQPQSAQPRLFSALLVLCAILNVCQLSWGQTFTGTGNWSDGSRWSTGTAPDAATASVIINGACTLDGAYVVGSLTINAGATLNGGSGFLSIRDGWTNNGTFAAGTGTVAFTTANVNAGINGLATQFNTLLLNRSGVANRIAINTAVTANALTLNQGTVEVTPATGSLDVTTLAVSNAAGQATGLSGILTVTTHATVNAGATLRLLGGASQLRVGGNLAVNGNLEADNVNATIALHGTTPASLSGTDVNLGARLYVAKTGAARVSITTGTATTIAGDLLVDSPLEVNRTLVVSGTTTLNSVLEARSSDITFNHFAINAGGTFSALASPTNIFLTGNWTSNAPGAVFNANNSTLLLTGDANSFITPGPATQFNRVTVQKTGGASVSYGGNALILRSDLTIQAGALLCTNTTNTSTAYSPSACALDNIAIPNPDLSVGGDLLIFNMAALRLDEDDNDNNPTGIALWLRGALTDNNLAEPAYANPARRGLLVGSQNVAMRISNLNRPFIVFTGGDVEVRGNVPQLRDSEGASSQGLGLALPNVVIYKDDNAKAFTINNGANADIPGDHHKLRVLGNLTVARGTLSLNATSLLFGDSQHDEVNVFGVFDATPGATLKMTTGGASRSGSILRGRRGGVVRFIGTPSRPVTVTREGQPGYYFGIGIYAGCKVYGYNANFSYLTSTNDDYNTNSPEQPLLTINEAGRGCALPGTGGYESYGGLKIYQDAAINPEGLADPTTDRANPFFGAQYNFSFCTFGGSSNGMTHLTINTGQTLTIRNILFTLPNGNPNSGSVADGTFQKFSNIVANNPSTNNLSTTVNVTTATTPLPTITVLSSTGNAAGLNAEYYDGGDYEMGYPNPNNAGTVPNGGKGRIVWESLPFFFWVGGIDDRSFGRPRIAEYKGTDNKTDWTNWKNWSLASNDPFYTGLTTYHNPEQIFPGQRTVGQSTSNDPPASLPARVSTQADALDYYEVFICRSATADPDMKTVGNITIQGSLVINSGITVNYANGDVDNVLTADNAAYPNVKVDRYDVSPHSANPRGNFRILYLRNNTLNVRGDLVAEVNGILDASGNGTIRVGGNMFMMANLPYNGASPAGDGGATRNSNQANVNTTFQFFYESGAPTVIIDGIGQQEIRMRRNVLHNLVIDKPYNSVGVQGLSGTLETTRFTVNNNVTIRSGGMMMLSNTPMLVNGDFILQGGSFNYNQKSYVTIRGNWRNLGGNVLLGSEAARINFHPRDNSPREIISAGQPFPQANFGHLDDTGMFNNGYWNDRTPEVLLSGGTEFANGIFGVNSNMVPKLVKASNGTTSTTYVQNTSAPALPTAVVTANVLYTIRDNFTSISLTSIYPNRTVTTAAGNNTIIRTAGMTIQNLGTLDLKGGAELLLQTLPATAPATNTLLVSAGAALNAIGTPSSYVKISRQNTSGSYAFQVDGTIRARYYLFEFMNQNGIDMTAATSQAVSPGLLNPALAADPVTNPGVGSFSDGILTNGTAGGTYLSLGANTFASGTVIYNTNFPLSLGAAGSGQNVRQAPFPATTAAAGTILYFKDATGVYSGENFDGDPNDAFSYTVTPPVPPPTGPKMFYGNIRWIDRIKRWTGGGLADTRWSTPANWTNSSPPTADDDVILDFSSPAAGASFANGYVVTIDGDPAKTPASSPAIARNLSVVDADAAGLPTGKKIFLIMTDYPASDLTVTGDYTAGDMAELRMTNGANNNVRIGKSWSNEGRFRGQSATMPIPASPLDVTGSVFLELGGVEFMNTPANNTGGTVEFTENVGKRVIQTGKAASGQYYDPFWNIDLKAGSTEINDVLRVNNDLTIRQGAVLDASLGNNPIFLRGNWLNDGGTFVPRQGRVTLLGSKTDASGTAQPTYITRNKTTGVAGGVENFFDLAIYKQHAPGSTDITVIGSSPNSVVLNNRVTVSSNLIFYRGRFVSATDKEMILLENAGFYRDSRDGNGNAFSPLALATLQNLGVPAAPGGSSTQVNFYSGYVNGPVGRFFSSATSDVTGRFPISKDGEYIADPVNGVMLTVRLTTGRPTVFSVEQFNANPDFPNTTAPRTIPAPLNYVSQNRYWVVKNIADSPVPFPGTQVGELLEGSISLPYRGSQEIDPTNPSRTFAAAAAMANLLQISIVQDHDQYSQPLPANVLRGTAPKGTAWKNLGGVLNPSSNSMMIATQSNFNALGNGVFTFGFNNVMLPVELVDLAAKARGRVIDVTWVTAKEENLANFAVQRSRDGKHFTDIGRIDAKGGNGLQTYRFTDAYPVPGNNYYRLRQVDTDNSVTFSKIVAANLDNEATAATGELTLYPNPLEGYQPVINVVLPEEVTGSVRVSVVDMKGQPVYSRSHSTTGGRTVAVNLGQRLPTGMYIVHVVSDAGLFQKKLVVR